MVVRTLGDGIDHRALSCRGHFTGVRDRLAVIGHLEDLRAQLQAHAMAGAAALVKLHRWAYGA